MKRGWLLPLFLISLTAVSLPAVPTYKVERIGACASSEVSEAIKSTLLSEGVRVMEDAAPFCEIWLRKVLPMKPGSSAPEYASLNPGDFVGVVIYSKSMGDYRGQALKAGTYTMRFQTMPADGNHMGVSPTQDYVLLAPASADKDPSVTLEYEALLDLSRKVAGTNHPTPLYLVAPASPGDAVVRDAEGGHRVLEIRTRGQAPAGAEIDFPLAIVMVGKGEG